MKISGLKILLIVLSVSFSNVVFAEIPTSKKERNLLSIGNDEFKNGNYKNAVDIYRDVLKLNPSLKIAEYNLALALLNISERDYNKKDAKPQDEAMSYFNKLSRSNSKKLAEKSIYNMGHIAYNNKDYATSISLYKDLLRRDPENENARKYLRMAQLKLKESKNQDKQNKDKEDNENNSHDDKQNNDNKQSEQPQQNNNQYNKQNPQQTSNNQINDANAEKILKSIENKEQETLMRIEQRKKNAKKTDKNAYGRMIEKPW